MLNYPIQKPSFISKELDEYFEQLNTGFNNDELEKAYYECLKKKYESYKQQELKIPVFFITPPIHCRFLISKLPNEKEQ